MALVTYTGLLMGVNRSARPRTYTPASFAAISYARSPIPGHVGTAGRLGQTGVDSAGPAVW